jgi:GDP-L-fucose synthase
VYEEELLNSKQSPDAVCRITWDTAKPNGTPRKLCDISRLSALGFTAKTVLRDGIKKAYIDFLGR